MSPSNEAIVAMLFDGDHTVPELAAELGLTASQVGQRLTVLVFMGRAHVAGTRPSGHPGRAYNVYSYGSSE